MLSCELYEISKNTFLHRTLLLAASDCLCCQELAALNEKLHVEKNATNTTEAEEFKTLCLNKVVLQNVLVGLLDARGNYLEEKTSNLSYRFASYRQFTWWVLQESWERK